MQSRVCAKNLKKEKKKYQKQRKKPKKKRNVLLEKYI